MKRFRLLLSSKRLLNINKGLVILLITCFVLPVNAQVKSQIIELHQLSFSFTPVEFYIENIIDSRVDQSSVAYLLISENKNDLTPFDLKNGFRLSLMQNIQKNICQNKSLRPVVIRVNNFNIRESLHGTGAVSGLFEIAFSFELKREGDYLKLIEYKSKATYIRPANDLSVVEKTLTKAIIASLTYFNTWINSESKINENLARSVRFNFNNYTKHTTADTLFYDPKRPLSWSDFKSKPQNSSKYAATIFSFFAVDSKSELINGIVEVNLNLKVYLVRSFSWVKDYARDAYTLNHEQRHFDITRIISDRFKRKLLSENIKPDNYEGIISFEYIESLRDLDRMQKLYDGETRYGADSAMQKIWNERIEKELRGIEANENMSYFKNL